MKLLACALFLALGSYLNSVAYRLLNLETFWKIRSFCPSCKTIIPWYDNIPLISWLYLQARCRSCHQPISWLYPFIELVTPVTLYLLWTTVPHHYFPAYFLFFAALIITIRTDFDAMLISRFATLYLIPVGIFAAYHNYLPLTPFHALAGAGFGYILLWIVKKIAEWITHQDCLGQGDLELLAFIGSFTGPFGCWISIMAGCSLGTIFTIFAMLCIKKRIQYVPLGAYLSMGAMLFVLYQPWFKQLYNL